MSESIYYLACALDKHSIRYYLIEVKRRINNMETFRYDLRSLREPTIIFIDHLEGKRSALPIYSYVVLPIKEHTKRPMTQMKLTLDQAKARALQCANRDGLPKAVLNLNRFAPLYVVRDLGDLDRTKCDIVAIVEPTKMPDTSVNLPSVWVLIRDGVTYV